MLPSERPKGNAMDIAHPARQAMEQLPSRIVITGASGWLGLATLEILHQLWGDDVHRRVVCFGSGGRTLVLRSGERFAQRPLGELPRLAHARTAVLHLAFLTREKADQMPLQEYVERNRAISQTVLRSLDDIGASHVFVASSGAVRMGAEGLARDLQSNPYGVLKLEDEAAFGQWARRTAGHCLIARVFNISGAYMNKTSSYALACLVDDALAGRPFSIRANRRVYRSYTSVNQLMSVALAQLATMTSPVETFETAGEEVVEMADLATQIARALGVAADVRRPDLADLPEDRYVADGSAYLALCRRHGVPVADLATQIRDTADWLADPARGPGP